MQRFTMICLVAVFAGMLLLSLDSKQYDQDESSEGLLYERQLMRRLIDRLQRLDNSKRSSGPQIMLFDREQGCFTPTYTSWIGEEDRPTLPHQRGPTSLHAYAHVTNRSPDICTGTVSAMPDWCHQDESYHSLVFLFRHFYLLCHSATRSW